MGSNLQNEPVPYAAFEGEQMRTEIREKRKDRIILVLIIAMLLNNLAWLWFFNQFDFEAQTVQQELDSGNANFIGNNGAITNGRADSNNN